MAAFTYEAVGLNGRRSRGIYHADSPDQAAERLEASGLTLLEMTEARFDPRTGRGFVPGEAALIEAISSISTLLKAGLPLDEALAAIADAADKRCGPLLQDIRDAIAEGSSVSDAFGRHPARFDAAAVGLLRSGERSGDLAGAFDMLVSIRERGLRLRSNLLTGAIYPVILALVSLLAGGMIVTVVIPRFASMVESAGGELPMSAALLLDVSSVVRTLAIPATVIITMTAVAFALAVRTPTGSVGLQVVVSRVPVLGKLRQCGAAARGARITGSLVKAGVPLMTALDAAADALGSSKEASAFACASADLRDGRSVGQAMSKRGFPPLLSRMARTGDDAGDVGSFMIAAADTLERMFENKVRRMGIILEPAIIIVLGALIGFVALAMFQAVYSLNGAGL